MATVGSAIGSTNERLQAIATGTAYVPTGSPCAAASVTDSGINIAANAMLDITCVMLTAIIIRTIVIASVEGLFPLNPSMSFMSHAAAPVCSNAAPRDSAPPKKTIKPQSTPLVRLSSL